MSIASPIISEFISAFIYSLVNSFTIFWMSEMFMSALTLAMTPELALRASMTVFCVPIADSYIEIAFSCAVILYMPFTCFLVMATVLATVLAAVC